MPQYPVNENILILSLKDNSLLDFSCAPADSSFKQLENNKFLVSEGPKKRVVKLNDVFDVYGNLYAFVIKDTPITLLQFEKKHSDFFILVNNCFLSFFKNIFHVKIIKLFLINLKNLLFKKNVIIFFTILFSLSLLHSHAGTRKEEDTQKSSLLETQKSLYSTYNYIVKNALPSSPLAGSSPSAALSSPGLTGGSRQIQMDPAVKPRDDTATPRDDKTAPRNNKTKARHISDPDVEYFLKMKTQK